MTATTDADLSGLAQLGAAAKDRRDAWILAHERRYLLESSIFGDRELPYSQAKKWTAYSPECIGLHPGRVRPPADRHSWLCGACTEGIRRDLFALAGCWAFLGELLNRGPGKQGERSGTNENAAAPLDLNVADLRLRISGWTADVLGQLLEDKPGATPPPADAPAPVLLRWLGRWHSYYIATHPQDSFPAAVLVELADLLGRVRAMTFPDGATRRPITSTCSVPAEDRTRCGGSLTALVRARTDPRGSVIVCDLDPDHVIPESEWLGILKTKTKGRPA
ncbi:hypothetical protein SEA_AOKA_50 [Arthrobacter phage Aoka]|nr:hypothetical protein SEA_AOKA_50 [Arthrobacter phage Aoka]